MTAITDGLDAYLQGYADGLAALGKGPLVRLLRKMKDGDIVAIGVAWVDQDDETGGYFQLDGREVTLIGAIETLKQRVIHDDD